MRSPHGALADATLVSTELPAGSHQVRLLDPVSQRYDRMIVVTERDGGGSYSCPLIGAPSPVIGGEPLRLRSFPRLKL